MIRRFFIFPMPKQKSQSKADATGADGAAEPASFEEALELLEDLVARMEGEDLPLEEMIVGYEKGMRLRGICEKRLEEAQAKVELIRDKGVDGDSAVDLEDFDSAGSGADATTSEAAESVTEGSDGELF